MHTLSTVSYVSIEKILILSELIYCTRDQKIQCQLRTMIFL